MAHHHVDGDDDGVGYGVRGKSDSGIGVDGESYSDAGVEPGGIGVRGYSRN
jgi:hypothetical protein